MQYQFDYKDYKKRVAAPVRPSFYLILFFIIILMGIAFFLMPKKTNYNYYYLVQTNEFKTFKEASTQAANIQQRGGAGYVFFDGTYHVFVGLYLNSESANSICNNLKPEFNEVKVFKLECKNYKNLNNLTATQNDAVLKIYQKNLQNIQKLYENLIKFDKNELNINNLKNFFENLATDYETEFNNLNACFSKNSKYTKAKQNAKNILDTLNNLSNHIETNELFRLKYDLIKIAIEHQSFVSCF